jgi:DNA-binding NtrC family response regulator
MNPKPRIVLIAEDEIFIRIVAVEMLIEAGFDVIEAQNAEDALAILKTRATEITLLFTDINMPGRFNGLKLAHQVHGAWPQIALLITSGASTPPCGDLPTGSRFLPKPYVSSDVVAQVRELTTA